MGLKIIMGRDGKPCRMWYGIVYRNGGRERINLGVPLAGTVPTNEGGYPTLSATGDEAFERSRRAAQKAYDRLMRTNRKKTDADLAAEVLEARTGQKAEGVALDDMGETWISAQPKKSNATWRNAERKWFADFAKCARREAKRLGRPCDGVKDITPEIVAAWIARIKSVYSFETVKRQVPWARRSTSASATGAGAARTAVTLSRSSRIRLSSRGGKPSTFPTRAGG